METTYLAVSWSTSKGQSTYGYNICRLDDTSTDKRYRCNGGGYDMLGTVFGEWLQTNYQSRLIAHAASQHYGARMYEVNGTKRISLDGSCGIETMRSLAELIGLQVKVISDRKGRTLGFNVTDTIPQGWSTV